MSTCRARITPRASRSAADRLNDEPSALFVLRSCREFARIALERFRIDHPAEIIVRVPRNYATRRVQFDYLAAHGHALVLRAVAVGVVKERLDSAWLLALAHRSPLHS